MSWGDFSATLEGETYGAVWITGGYKTNWISAEEVEQFAGVTNLIVQDCFASPLWERADYQIPAATFAEREGSYVNVDGRLQSFAWAIRPPAGVKTEGQLFWQLNKKAGLYRAEAVLEEMTREIPYFSAAIYGVPETGVDLTINQIAAAEPVTAAIA